MQMLFLKCCPCFKATFCLTKWLPNSNFFAKRLVNILHFLYLKQHKASQESGILFKNVKNLANKYYGFNMINES